VDPIITVNDHYSFATNTYSRVLYAEQGLSFNQFDGLSAVYGGLVFVR